MGKFFPSLVNATIWINIQTVIWHRYLSPAQPQSIRSWFRWGQCPITLVKTLTATSSRLHEPITDCCTSESRVEAAGRGEWRAGEAHAHEQTMDTSLQTIEGVVPRVHLAELCHVLHWVTAGRGGAYAWLTGDAKSLQSVQKQNRELCSFIWVEHLCNRKNHQCMDMLFICLLFQCHNMFVCEVEGLSHCQREWEELWNMLEYDPHYISTLLVVKVKLT